jgi:hypothetical protein
VFWSLPYHGQEAVHISALFSAVFDMLKLCLGGEWGGSSTRAMAGEG